MPLSWSQRALALVTSLVGLGACGDAPGNPATTSADESTEASLDSSASGSTSSSSETKPPPTGGFFVDDGGPVPISDCDPFAQVCPEGEKCAAFAHGDGMRWDANKCVAIIGDQALGEACVYDGPNDASDDCATGMCWNAVEVEGELVGTCVDFCSGVADDPQCPDGLDCLIGWSGAVVLCLPTCDPLLQDCAEGESCRWMQSEFFCLLPASPGGPGDACLFFEDCDPGLACLAGEVVPGCQGESCCSPFCDTTSVEDECGVLPGASCEPFFEEGQAFEGHETLGVCAVLP